MSHFAAIFDASNQWVQMNRPFGAVDVSSNLKGAVPKAATQKILLALAEKGEVTQKLYGKKIDPSHRYPPYNWY